MSRKRTDKEYFIFWSKKVKNYRGDKKKNKNLYKRFLKLCKSGKRPSSIDFFPTITTRSLDYYLERFWSLEDAKNQLRKLQGGRYDDPIKREVAIKKCKESLSQKTSEEIIKINKSKGSNYKDPERMAQKYGISVEDAKSEYIRRTKIKTDNLKKTFEKMGGYKREWSCKCVEYWLLRGLDEDEAKLKIKEISPDTRSVSGIMSRYNFNREEAERFFNDVTEKGRKTFEARPQHEKDEILKKRTTFSRKYSMASSKFFKKLLASMIRMDSVTIRVDEREYFLWDYDNRKIYFYDFCIPELNIMIEYNGIMFHPRVKDTIFTTVERSIKKDTIKNDLAIKNGFDLFWYWEKIDDEAKMLKMYKKEIENRYNVYTTKINTN